MSLGGVLLLIAGIVVLLGILVVVLAVPVVLIAAVVEPMRRPRAAPAPVRVHPARVVDLALDDEVVARQHSR